jgi:short-subunit dehydrogenase
MTGWLQRLEDAWSLRRRPKAARSPEDDGCEPVVLITGASEGIGRALANEFARAGNSLFLVARNEAALAKAAAEIERDFGVRAHYLAVDLATSRACDTVTQALAARKLYADVLVNNAAIGLLGPFATQGREELLHLIDLNMRTFTDLMYCLLQGMLKRGQGGVLNVASVAGYVPGPGQAAYYASKAYVLSLTEAVAYETRGRGVRISALVPGPVDTRFHARMGAQGSPYRLLHPSMSAEAVARAGYQGFRCRRLLIVPGLIPLFNTLVLRLIPHMFITPFMGWFLRRRLRD